MFCHHTYIVADGQEGRLGIETLKANFFWCSRELAFHFGLPSFLVVTPLSVVDLPKSYKDALAGVTSTFRASFQPFD
jgi:hypothetical protein